MKNKTKTLYETKYLSLKSAPSPSGKGEWAYSHRPNVHDVVIIVPYINDDDGERVLFLKTKRPPLVAEGKSTFNIELPAGLVGDEDVTETLLGAAAKELSEEAGLKAERFEVATRKLSSSGGCTSEVCSVVIAYITDCFQCSCPQSDNGVIVDRVEVKLEDIPQWLKEKEEEGCTIGAQTLSGLWHLSAKLGK